MASLYCSCTVLFLVPDQTTSPHSAHHEVGVMFCILGEGVLRSRQVRDGNGNIPQSNWKSHQAQKWHLRIEIFHKQSNENEPYFAENIYYNIYIYIYFGWNLFLCKIVVLDRKLFPYGNILLSLNTHFAKAAVSIVIASLRDATPSCLAALQGGHNYISTGYNFPQRSPRMF